MKIKSTILALSVGTAMGMMVATQAQAGVLTSSIFEVRNFLLIDENGNAPTGITITRDSRRGEMAVGLNGNNPPAQTGQSTGGMDLNLAPIQLGTPVDVLPNDSRAQLPDGTGTFARSDMFVSGQIFGANTEGGQGLTRADTYGITQSYGNANSTISNNVTATYEIEVGEENATVAFALDADIFLRTYVSPDLFGTFSDADGSTTFSITVTEVGTPGVFFSWAPGELNNGSYSSDVAGGNENVLDASYSLTSDTRTLISGRTYQVTIQQGSTARFIMNSNDVPEPNIIMLLGIGLVGFGFIGRLRKNALQA